MAKENKNDQLVFWGCFIALITTAFGFVGRLFLIGVWADQFGLDPAQAGRLAGIGIWPFAVSIIGFSLFIDKIGYKTAMFIAFLGHSIWVVMGVSAYFVGQDPANSELAYRLLYWGSFILALGNGTVEAFINPVVATMFSREKTKWLNILHAGWPGGLVLAGIITIYIDYLPWGVKVGIIAVPAIIYFLMLLPCKFPVSERVASKVSYREMLSEFGILGAAVVGFLVALQLMDFFTGAPGFSVDVGGKMVLATWAKALFWGIGAAIVIAFGIYTRSLGRPLMFVLILIMMPLATTEIGTDGWITAIMEDVAKSNNFHPGWVLVYTSFIMMVLRFCAGPIVHAFSPLGLLAASAVLAILGLYSLSITTGLIIFGAATLYGLGKTFFWPTMLGVVAEQCPKGGALTLNAISGIGMLAVGTLGFPLIGALQSYTQINGVAQSAVAEDVPGLVDDGKLTAVVDKKIYEVIQYKTIDDAAVKGMLVANYPADEQELKKIETERAEAGDPVKEDEIVLTGKQEKVWKEIEDIRGKSNQGALFLMTVFPLIMLIGYVCLIIYFASKGGYQAQVLVGHEAEDEKFTGGVEGPADM